MARNITIDRIGIKRFGCVQEVELKLSPIQALIGPNDSGKSTILRAARTGMHLLTDKFIGGFPEIQAGSECLPFHPGIHKNAEIDIGLFDSFNYIVGISSEVYLDETLYLLNKSKINERRRLWDTPATRRQFLENYGKWTKSTLREFGLPEDIHPGHPSWGSPEFQQKYGKNIQAALNIFNAKPSLSNLKPRMIRLDPDSLRLPGSLIPSSQQIDIGEKGVGLASIYDALMNRNLDYFIKIREKFIKLFSTVLTISLKNVSTNSKILEVELKDGNRIPAQFMSEGMLYYLAFAAIQYLEPASILLVEEPENGLHPSRIKDIMNILREISETTQIVIATHSPLVINELKEDEVTIVWRDEEKGTQVTPIRETANFADRSKVYALGELWLSYADGINEETLRTGTNQSTQKTNS